MMVDGRVWTPGARWFEPEEKHFKNRLRKFRQQSSLPKEWAIAGAEKINDKFNLQAVFEHYNSELGDIL